VMDFFRRRGAARSKGEKSWDDSLQRIAMETSGSTVLGVLQVQFIIRVDT
jgi:hypothetical protein